MSVLALFARAEMLVDSSFSRFWGSSNAAWICRLLLGLNLALQGWELRGVVRFGSTSVAVIILSLGIASGLAPQEPGSPFYIPGLSALTLGCFALATLLLHSAYSSLQPVVPWLALCGIVLNGLTLLGYLYDATPLYGGIGGGVGLCSAATSLVLGVGFLASAGLNRSPVRLLTGQSVSAQVLRSILPVTCAAMLLGEIVSDLIRGGPRKDFAVQDALQTFFATLFIAGVVILLARRVGKRLDRAEQERDTAQAALSHINERLAEKVAARTEELQRANGDLRREIARRSEFERALRESEAKSNALLAALPDWIFRLRLDGTLLDWRSPREDLQRNELNALRGTLTAKMRDWLLQNPQFGEQETVDFGLPDETQ